MTNVEAQPLGEPLRLHRSCKDRSRSSRAANAALSAVPAAESCLCPQLKSRRANQGDIGQYAKVAGVQIRAPRKDFVCRRRIVREVSRSYKLRARGRYVCTVVSVEIVNLF